MFQADLLVSTEQAQGSHWWWAVFWILCVLYSSLDCMMTHTHTPVQNNDSSCLVCVVGEAGNPCLLFHYFDHADKDINEYFTSQRALPWGSCGRTWHSHSGQSCLCSRSSPPSSWSIGFPWSRDGRRSWTCHSPPGWSGSDQTWSAGRHSHSCTHSDGPQSFCPRRR